MPTAAPTAEPSWAFPDPSAAPVDPPFTITSAYPTCTQEAQAAIAYVETGHPTTMDVQYGSAREYIQYLTGDTRRIEITKFASPIVAACESRQRTAEAQQARATAAQQKQQHDDAIGAQEAATCDNAGGKWGNGVCYITYRSAQYGSVGGFTVMFDKNGKVTGDRGDCPDAAWHAETHICSP